MENGMIDVCSLTMGELEQMATNLGEQRFRGRQVFSWLHGKRASSFDSMTNLPAALRSRLGSSCTIARALILDSPVSYSGYEEQYDADGQSHVKKDNFRAKKYLLEVGKNTIIESVLMRYDYGDTLCISTQAGCRMGCVFCASSLNGLERNLEPGEMSAQLYAVMEDTGIRVSNIVLMGCGEPFDNFENIVKFLENTTNEEGFGLSQRGITVSTCGIAPRIRDFARLKKAYGLAVSLHAPNDDARREIMPVARAYSLAELMSACDEYTSLTNRRISYEYAMIHNNNDSTEQAHELGTLLRGRLAHVNLIPLNSVQERGLVSGSRKRLDEFIKILKTYGVTATPRVNLGQDINAACGQLRAKWASR